MLKNMGNVLIALSVPATLIWLPIATLPGVGNITLSDIVFLLLWIIVFLKFIALRRISKVFVIPLRILVFAICLGMLSAFGSAAFGGTIGPVSEMALFMKRFGLASILPLAFALTYSEKFLKVLQLILVIGLIALFIFSMYPELQYILPVHSSSDVLYAEMFAERATGLISNPNDFAYISIIICASVVAISFLTSLRYRTDRLLVYMAILIGAANLVVSGSRSAVLGTLAGLLYWIATTKIALGRKLFLIVFTIGAAFTGIATSETFSQRMKRVVENGAGEENVSSRLEAQYIAFSGFLENPLGVGYANFNEATRTLISGSSISQLDGSDSIYFDTLLGAGIIGFLTLLLLYRDCWHNVLARDKRYRNASVILKSICIAVFMFGFATVAPISVFVAPFFFLMIGIGFAAQVNEI